MLAYMRVLADPDDEVSARRIVNMPKRGIGRRSVSRLTTWAASNGVSFSVAIDRAAEAGLKRKALRGAEQLSEMLTELRTLMDTMGPGNFVRLVAERIGYKAELVAEDADEADGRTQPLARVGRRGRPFRRRHRVPRSSCIGCRKRWARPGGLVGPALRH